MEMLVEMCHVWARNNKMKYTSYEELALDFGKRGTKRFFPLSVMTKMISNDYRFEMFLL